MSRRRALGGDGNKAPPVTPKPPDLRGDEWDAQISAAAGKPLETAWLADRIAATADITRARALCAQALALDLHGADGSLQTCLQFSASKFVDGFDFRS